MTLLAAEYELGPRHRRVGDGLDRLGLPVEFERGLARRFGRGGRRIAELRRLRIQGLRRELERAAADQALTNVI